jgi:alpha-beta hydrolase superfamily lysophospholipase
VAHGSGNAVKEETFEGVGGLKIFLRSWRPVSKPRAVVVICHGVNSHGGQYIGVAEQFAASGFAVYALDLRGLESRKVRVSTSATSRNMSATLQPP